MTSPNRSASRVDGRPPRSHPPRRRDARRRRPEAPCDEPRRRHLRGAPLHELAGRGLASPARRAARPRRSASASLAKRSPEQPAVRRAAGARRSVACVTTPSVPSLPDEERHEVVARDVLAVLAAEREDRAARHDDHAQPRDVASGRAVLGGARAAGVLGDVAADRARAARGGIRRIEETEPLDLLLERLRDDARLDDGEEILAVDLEDPVHPGQVERDAAGRRAAPRPRGPCARPGA